MKKIFLFTLLMSMLSSMAFYAQTIPAKEDTAQLKFSKTAVPQKKSQTYTVQEGEVLSTIIRKIAGVTEKDVPRYYKLVKELNPDIPDINRLYAGQKILLPGKIIAVTKEKTLSPKFAGSQKYAVQKGDNLIQIVHRELHITTGTQKTLLLIKSMNPNLKNANIIYPGQIILLPKDETATKDAPVNINADKEILTADQKIMEPAKVVDEKESIVLPPATRMAVIKHILSEMNGTIITRGNYYLPISKTEQLTIDCSVIPVVELDDRTTVFLDLGGRSKGNLKKMIGTRWNNYHLVKIDDKDDIILTLKKILSNSKTYEITKSQKPLSVGSLPVLEVIVDWIIAKKDQRISSSKIQGLRFVYEDKALLPRAVVNYARQHSLVLTEISPERGLAGKPEEIYSLPPMTILPTSSAKDFAQALLSYLNIPVEMDADVRVFNIDKDGFNLSIKTDMVVTRDTKKTLLFSRTLPPQFIDILENAGNKLIFLSDKDEPAKNMEKILSGFNFTFMPGDFTFSGLDKNQPPYSLGFSGTKIITDKDIYVVNFDFHQALRGLLQETWSANMIRY